MNSELYLNYVEMTEKEINQSFMNACRDGNLKAIKYLLTSSELNIKANIDFNDNQGIFLASLHGHLEIIDYLLTSKDLINHANIYAQQSLSIKTIINNVINTPETYPLFDYLVFNYKIELNEDIKEFFFEEPQYQEFYKIILKRELDTILNENNKDKKRIKV